MVLIPDQAVVCTLDPVEVLIPDQAVVCTPDPVEVLIQDQAVVCTLDPVEVLIPDQAVVCTPDPVEAFIMGQGEDYMQGRVEECTQGLTLPHIWPYTRLGLYLRKNSVRLAR
ncbi:hypothetical protein [Salimicrobium salexigens]|uniref:Uncharacterized protein n=1 Tax=Salimicrobium salexigens TaxID=908941 RepID=A0ABY1KZP3_9BACI|nr:hypothetical protein [Salimicrobium salexigens]SIS97884.1 hypothetical protein SAMN05421758_11525 [Salimicrobium salexigens]